MSSIELAMRFDSTPSNAFRALDFRLSFAPNQKALHFQYSTLRTPFFVNNFDVLQEIRQFMSGPSQLFLADNEANSPARM